MRLDEFVNNKKLTEFEKPKTRGLAGNLLKQHGYEKIGKGSYASVWAKPGEEYIVKIFDNGDASYKKFVNLAQSNPNDHFPKFKGKMFQMTDNYSAVRMERLEPMSEQQFLSIGLGPVYHYLNYLKNPDGFYLGEEQLKDIMAKMDQLEKDQPGIKSALETIAKNFTSFDVKPDNFMLRGDTVVITDPVL